MRRSAMRTWISGGAVERPIMRMYALSGERSAGVRVLGALHESASAMNAEPGPAMSVSGSRPAGFIARAITQSAETPCACGVLPEPSVQRAPVRHCGIDSE